MGVVAFMVAIAAFVNSSALEYVYAFAEIVNMENIRGSLDDED